MPGKIAVLPTIRQRLKCAKCGGGGAVRGRRRPKKAKKRAAHTTTWTTIGPMQAGSLMYFRSKGRDYVNYLDPSGEAK